MFEKMIMILPAITLFLFAGNLIFRGNNIQSSLLFILALLPLMDLKITPEAYGGFKVFDLLCFYCLIFYLRDFLTINTKNKSSVYFVLFVILIITILLGGLASEFPDKTILFVIKTLPIFIFARFLMSECFKDPSFHVQAVGALKVAYISALVFLGIQWVVGLGFTFYPGLNPNTIDPVFKIVRYPGIFYDSQAHGQYLAMGSFLFLYIKEGATSKARLINYGIFIAAIIAINIAGSRAAFGGFAFGVFVSFILASPKYRAYAIALLITGYLVFTFLPFKTGVADRSENLSSDMQFRQNLWKEAFDIAKEHPLLGIGIGNYKNYVIRHSQGQYLEFEDGKIVYFDQPESGYLKILVELGFIGFGIFVLYMFLPLVRGAIALIRKTVDNRIAFFMAALLCWLVAFTTVYSIYDYRLLIMVTCLVVLIVSYPAKADNDHPLA